VTNIMGEPLRGRVDLALEAHDLDELRAVRDAAVRACDGWSDGEDDAEMDRLCERLDRAYRKWRGER
jgi:hypothetical protein